MNQLPPDEYLPDDAENIIQNTRYLLNNRHQAVIAMSSGGCARYAFSLDVDYCLDRQGYPLIHYSSDNAHHHLIVTNSTMDFRIVRETSPDGMELSIFILTGMLTLVDPGDHDNIDRYSRYFDVNIENYSRGCERLYRFTPSQARNELISGENNVLPVSELIRKNVWTPSQEQFLLEQGSSLLADKSANSNELCFAGIDGYGADLVESGNITRLPFEQFVDNPEEAQQELVRLIQSEPVLNP